MIKYLITFIVLCLVFSNVYGAETHMDRNITAIVANGQDSVYNDQFFADTYNWQGTNKFAHIDYQEIALLGTWRHLITFDLSEIESDNVLIKQVKMTTTYAPLGGDTDTLDYKALFSLYSNLDDAETVYDDIGDSSYYADDVASGVFQDLGIEALFILGEHLYDGDDAWSVGIMGYSELGDVENVISSNVLYVKYFYPPDEADTWEINESYPLGIGSGLGVGACSSTEAIEITAAGTLFLLGDTALTVPSGNYLSIDYGGGLEIETGEGASLTIE